MLRKPQKQPLEVFCKRRYAEKLCQFHRKTLVLESLFNKNADLQIFRSTTLLEREPTQVFSCESCEIFKKIDFEEHLWTTASKNQYVTEKTIYLFFSQNYLFIIIAITFESLKFLLFFCAVIVFAGLFYKNILSSLLCYLSSSELIDCDVKAFFLKIASTLKNPRAIYIHSKSLS